MCVGPLRLLSSLGNCTDMIAGKKKRGEGIGLAAAEQVKTGWEKWMLHSGVVCCCYCYGLCVSSPVWMYLMLSDLQEPLFCQCGSHRVSHQETLGLF